MIHWNRQFIALLPHVAFTRCGIYIDADKATWDRAKVQCRKAAK